MKWLRENMIFVVLFILLGVAVFMFLLALGHKLELW